MRRLLLLCLCLLVLAPKTSGQGIFAEPSHPLLDLLGVLPDDAEQVAFAPIYYANFDALASTSPVILDVPDYATFEATGDFRPWLRYRGDFGFIQTFTQTGLEMPAAVGFDLFDIDHALVRAQPPDYIIAFDLDYDADAVRAAHAARDYEQRTLAGEVEVWCGNADCDGTRSSLGDVNYGNVFDPRLGRRPGVFLLEGQLASVFNAAQVPQVAAIIRDGEGALADNADYAALVTALTDPDLGTLMQAMLLPPTSDRLDYRTPAPIDEVAQIDFDQLTPPVPPFRHMAAGDYQDGDEQVFVLALLYNNERIAELGGTLLAEYMALYASLFQPDGARELLVDLYDATSAEPQVIAYDDDRYLARVELRYPIQQNERTQVADDLYIPQGDVYHVYYRDFLSQLFYPLWRP